MESSLQKLRRKHFPPLPESAQAFDEMLKSEEWAAKFGTTLDGKPFYRENIIEGGSSNLIFLSENAKEIVRESEELHVDGTFKTVPAILNLKQLLVVTAIRFDHTFPVAYCLMERRTYGAYESVLEFIKNLAPMPKLQAIMSDFEAALLKALDKVFPNAEISGCWWHYCNSILKKIKKKRLTGAARHNAEARRVLHMCMSLPLLPADNIEPGLAEVRNHVLNVDLEEGLSEKIVYILDYIKEHWVEKVGVEHLSVFMAARRTNNNAESFNMKLKREIGVHPSAWNFIDRLQKIEKSTSDDYGRAMMNRPLSRERKARYISRDRNLMRLSHQMEAGHINIKDFLLAAAGTIGENVRLEDENSSDDEEEEDLGPPVARIPPVDDNIAGQDIEVGDPGVEEVINLLEEGEGDYRGPDLLNYRLQAIALDIQGIAECPPPEFVINQIRELEVDFLDIEESLQHNAPLPLCLLCLTNTASRLVVPCGHWTGCAECTLRLIRVPTYLHVQGENDIVPLRLPIRCTLCKCLVGRLIRAFL